MAGQLDGHHLHHPSVAETHHRHLVAYPYHRLAISRVGFLGGERQHGPPPLAVHEYPSLGSHPDRASDGTNLADHPLPAGDGRPPSERAQGAQDAEEHAPHEHRDDHDGAEQHSRVGNACPEERHPSQDERQDGTRGGQAVVGNRKIYEEQREPDENQNHPDRRRYHHRLKITVWRGRRYAGNGSIVGPGNCIAHHPNSFPPGRGPTSLRKIYPRSRRLHRSRRRISRLKEAQGTLRRSGRPFVKAASHSSDPTTEGSSAGGSGSATLSRNGRCHHTTSCHAPSL